MAVTRRNAEVWLLGKGSEELSSARLASNGDALRLLMYYHVDGRCSVKQSAYHAVEKMLEIWQRARIPCQRIDACVRVLLKLFDDYQRLKKNRTRNNNKDKENQEEFKVRLCHLFDIATSDALSSIKNEEDRQFLVNQRLNIHSCSMAGVDEVLAGMEKRRCVRNDRAASFKAKMSREMCSNSVLSTDDNSCSLNDSSSATCDADTEFIAPKKSTRHIANPRKRSIIGSSSISAALDRVNLPDRGATFVASEVAKALGHNIKDITLSRSSIRRSRIANRQKASNISATTFSNLPLLLHWDTKMLPDIEHGVGGKKTVDRIAIIVTSGGEEMLLGVPKINSGSGENQANICIATLDEWGLRDQVHGLVFDTTASNTGWSKGACAAMQKSFANPIAWIACRHHMMEIVLAAVFKKCFPVACGPEVPLFKRFQSAWPTLDRKDYAVASDDMFAGGMLLLRTEMLNFLKSSSLIAQTRDDYKELQTLCYIFLGEQSLQTHSFRAPGAFHHARWMSKAIYALKIVLFRRQFELTNQESRGITEVALFVSLLYARYWHECGIPVKAPLNDICFLQQLENYPNRPIANVASSALCRHLWYLSEILVGLALFDDRIDDDVKYAMVENLHASGSNQYQHRLLTLPKPLSSAVLPTCVSQRTSLVFDLVATNGNNKASIFLRQHPRDWNDDAAYRELKEAAMAMTVVNDCAERAIALMHQYNFSGTRNEEQKQFLLKLVQHHRAAYPSCSKANLLANNSPNCSDSVEDVIPPGEEGDN